MADASPRMFELEKKKTSKHSKAYCPTEGRPGAEASQDGKHNEWIVIYSKKLSMQFKLGL